MLLQGSVEGGIELVGGGSDVEIIPTLSSGTKIADFTIDSENGSLYAPTPESPIEYTASSPLSISNENDISIDLSGYASTSYVSNQILGMTQYVDGNFQRKLSAGTGIDIGLDNTISTDFDISNYQPKLTAGTGIDITDNVISATGGAWDLPTNGTPLEIGTFGNMTLYVQSVSVSANTYSLCRFWTGQSGDIVLLASAIAVCNANPPTKLVVPSSITNQASFSWYTDDYEANPHLSIYSTLDSNLWSRGATIKGVVIFAR